ncbi:hypothetical protein [Botrimarina mediterranea]|nr:hypothetical protein [Botrimarina mediterranea]
MPSSPWPSLTAAYGPGRQSALLNRAIRAEFPGGAELIEALALGNRTQKWDNPGWRRFLTLLEAAHERLKHGGVRSHVFQVSERVRYLLNESDPAASAADLEAIRDGLRAARDLARRAVLDRHAAGG